MINRQHYPAAQARQITLKFSLSPTAGRVQIKSLHLEQILDNLITNAIQYSPVKTTITCKVLLKKQHLQIKVIDEGSGIAHEERELIFKPFYRTRAAAKIKGTGLGLSIVQSIATLYRGSCDIFPLNLTEPALLLTYSVTPQNYDALRIC